MFDLLELKAWHESLRRKGNGAVERPQRPPLEPPRRSHDSQADYVPSPEEIRQRCLEIQNEWSERERRRRAAGSEITHAVIRVHRATASV